jgi:tetratricopeptide (TPR) repeat protein
MSPRLLGLGITFLLGTVCAPSVARPSIWDRVRDERVDLAYRVLRTADQARTSVPGAGFDPLADQVLSLQAAVLIELAEGQHLPGKELRFLYGDSLIWAHAGREETGRRILLELLREDPQHPLAGRALFAIAIASSWLEDRAQEDAAYTRALEVEWDPEKRSRIYLNRGETRMLAGDLDAARLDYERSLSFTHTSEGYALAEWGLAVALSRAGDLPRALQHASRAVALNFPGARGRTLHAIDLPGVFFSPVHEIHYYRALGAMAEAEGRGLEAAEVVSHYERALDEWDEYLRRARARKDPWVVTAQQQRGWCQSRLDRARTRVKQPAGRKRSRAGD